MPRERRFVASSGGPSISVTVAQDNPGGSEKNPEIERNRPMFEVIQVVLDALFHLVQRGCLAAKAVDLGPTGNTRPDLMADHVAVDQPAVLLVVRHRVRPWAHDAHRARDDVEQLRKLIERGPPQEGAKGRDAAVVLARLNDAAPVFAYRHRAEL